MKEYNTVSSKKIIIINVFFYSFIIIAAILLIIFGTFVDKHHESLEILKEITQESVSIENSIYINSDIELNPIITKIDKTNKLFDQIINNEKRLGKKNEVNNLKESQKFFGEFKQKLINFAEKQKTINIKAGINDELHHDYEIYENSLENYREQISNRVLDYISLFSKIITYSFLFFIILTILTLFSFHFYEIRLKKYINAINEKNNEIIKTKIELEKTEHYYTNLFENMIEGVAVYELLFNEYEKPIDYIIIEVNKAYKKLHGVERNNIIGTRVSTLYESKKSPLFETCVNVALTRNPTSLEVFYHPMQKHLRLAIFSPEPNKFAIIFFDITEAVNLNHQLEEERHNLEKTVEERTSELKKALMKQKELSNHKDRFMSNMSHELRTPLNAILGFAQALQLKIYGTINEKQTENINLIIDSGNHLLSLIDDILDMTRIDLGSLKLESSEVDLNKIIKDLFSMMKRQFDDKEISLEYYIKDEITITADERKLKQILLNLLSNALKFTLSGGKVILFCEKHKDDRVKITIEDTGIGIKPDELSSIFEEFYQTEDTKFQARGGAGIGLFLTKKMVELHNGNIYVESEEHKGSKFWFTLPIKQFS